MHNIYKTVAFKFLFDKLKKREKIKGAFVKIGIMGAGFETGNLGVNALADSAIGLMLETFPDAEIVLIDFDHNERNYELRYNSRNYNISFLPLRYSPRLNLPNSIIRLLVLSFIYRFSPRFITKSMMSNNRYLKEISSCDFIASIAGGDSFSDIYGFSRLLYVGLPILLGQMVKCKTVFLPQTYGPFKSVASKKFAKLLLSRNIRIYSRDSESRVKVLELMNEKRQKVTNTHDMAFTLQPNFESNKYPKINGNLINGEEKIIGINVSGLLYMGGYSNDNMFSLKADYKTVIDDILEYFITKKGITCLLVPHVIGLNNSEGDDAVCRTIYNKFKGSYGDKLLILEEKLDQREIKYVISKCDFFIGARMHATIAALSQCIPAVALAYSRKFKGVYDSIGMSELVCDPRILNNKQCIDFITSAYESNSEYQKRLKKNMPIVVQRVRDDINSLKQLF